MTTNPHRCPACWSSLPPAVNDVCPHCLRPLVQKAPRRRWREKPAEAASPSSAPPAAESPSSPPSPVYVPYEPPPPPPPPLDAPPAPAAAPAAVAVLERDPAEFPGQPLPPGFFDALPERARRAPRKINRKLLLVGVVVVITMGRVALESAQRDAAVDSPARHLVAGACAEYRDFTTRLDRNAEDIAAFQQAVVWFQGNVDRFAAAAALDSGLSDAADVVVWFDRAIEADFAPFDAMSDGELQDLEQPLIDACYTGPGRA